KGDNMGKKLPDNFTFAQFDREFFNADKTFTVIGKGSLGGKARGLAFMKETLGAHFENNRFEKLEINIPTLTVICTDYFDIFMEQNNLHEIAYSERSDEDIARKFQKGSMPAQIIGDLRALIEQIHSPLAIRSSCLLEDDMHEPFAGVYATKMIPNNQHSPDARFNKLIEAIKFVYASTFFKAAKSYIKATGKSYEDEKMAVIIQEVVGLRHNDSYYPHISGVARSYNFYPTGNASPEEGVVNLALGLGKTIVDNGVSWNYSPAYPQAPAPFNSINDTLKNTQNKFWAVNMGKTTEYDPVKETEYLVSGDIKQAEEDDVLKWLASTFVPQSDKIYPGIGQDGPRIINFSLLLEMDFIPINSLIKELLKVSEERIGEKVEIEFAVTIEDNSPDKVRFGFLQVRPMVVSSTMENITDDEWDAPNILLRTDSVMGNGSINTIENIVAVKPDIFQAKNTLEMVPELEKLNEKLVKENKPYLLIVLGRLGSSDPWLGIPAQWPQVSGAKAIAEATLPSMNVDFSQGSHFFHNINSLGVFYFSISHHGSDKINWDWLVKQKIEQETKYFTHYKLGNPLNIKVDGRQRKGIIEYGTTN
ncbi:MAG: hypothetical protein KAR38_13665, partial [Calditrichia bacterium]|nr:hypothetical protein [Calditrichia bacterium]